jgi:MFS family permease
MNLKQKNWFHLFETNFLGVFNDNFLKHCIIFIAVTWHLPVWLSQSQLISVVAAALVIPYLLFSPLAGSLAVKYSKQRVWRLLKLLEIPTMVLASLAFYFQWVWLAVFAVLLLGVLSTLYSPSKYGLIRDIGGQEGVSFGSGIFEAMAFLGILIGSVAAPFISDHYHVWLVIAILLVVAGLGYYTSIRLRVKELPEENDAPETINPLKFLLESYRYAEKHRYLNSAVLGTSIFWMIGGMIQMNVVIHCTKTLGTTNSVAGIILCCAAVGIALGCAVAGILAKKMVRPAMIPIGLSGMIICLVALIFFQPTVWMCGLLVFSLALMGGFFEVPCMALVQHADLGRKLGNMIAYLNLVNFLFVLLGTLLFSVTTLLTKDNSVVVFGVITIVCSLTLLYYLIRHPEFLNGKVRL